jgi:ribosomal-protein-alanine N-acetyltransferase
MIIAPRPVAIAVMEMGHLDQVVALEQASFATPWSRTSFVAELQGNRFARSWIAHAPGEPHRVLGYLCAWVVYEELRIQNLAVDRAWRQQGIGSALLAHVLEVGRKANCLIANLEVRPANVAARTLYRGFGFQETMRRPGYYVDTAEDALVLTLDLRVATS